MKRFPVSKGIVPYAEIISPKKISATSSRENILTEEGDCREKVTKYDDISMCIGQLSMVFLTKVKAVGTATLVKADRGKDTTFFLITCAHNLYHNMYGFATGLTFYRALFEGDAQSCDKIEVNEFYVSNEYLRLMKEDASDVFCGHDWAICLIDQDLKFPTKEIPDLLRLNDPNDELEEKDQITVTGYPGDKKFIPYHQWTMNGNISDITRKQNYGAVILYDNIDTTGGQSGSPVIFNSRIVAIHCGGSTRVNGATLITPLMKKQIRNVLINVVDEQKCTGVNRLHYESTIPSVWFLGKTGHGKSSLLNCLAPKACAKVSGGNESETSKIRGYTSPWFDSLDKAEMAIFWDSPGFFDSGEKLGEKCRDQMFTDMIFNQLKKLGHMSSFIIVIRSTERFSKDLQDMVYWYKNLLQIDNHIWDFILFVITAKDYDKTYKKKGIQGWIKDLKIEELNMKNDIKKLFDLTTEPHVLAIGSLQTDEDGVLYEDNDSVLSEISARLRRIKSFVVGNFKAGNMDLGNIERAMLPEVYKLWKECRIDIENTVRRNLENVVGPQNVEKVVRKRLMGYLLHQQTPVELQEVVVNDLNQNVRECFLKGITKFKSKLLEHLKLDRELRARNVPAVDKASALSRFGFVLSVGITVAIALTSGGTGVAFLGISTFSSAGSAWLIIAAKEKERIIASIVTEFCKNQAAIVDEAMARFTEQCDNITKRNFIK